jgi:endoglucanase
MNMKKLLFLSLIIPFVFFVSCPTDSGPSDPGLTAAEYFESNNLFIGWNIGNSLDGSSETGWGNPQISRDLLNGVKQAGFNVVRIPVTWHFKSGSPLLDRSIGPAPDYTLNAARLNRVAAVVDMAHEAGLVVIINIHHDGNQDETNSFWLNIRAAGESEESCTAITAQFAKVWEQIAKRFKDYGEWLIFEPFNEIHNRVQNAGAWGWGTVPPRELEVINEWNQVFTDVVRASGGNNAKRYLVIQPYYARVHQAVANAFVLPTDTVEGKQIVSMHWYYPEGFALNGKTSWFDDTRPEWGSDVDKNAIINGSFDQPNNTNGVGFKHFKEKYTDKGIPVIIGECGATYQNRTGEDGERADADRLAYLTFFCEQAKAHGLVPILWDNGRNTGGAEDRGEMFGLLERYGGQPLSEREDELITAMVNAVK